MAKNGNQNNSQMVGTCVIPPSRLSLHSHFALVPPSLKQPLMCFLSQYITLSKMCILYGIIPYVCSLCLAPLTQHNHFDQLRFSWYGMYQQLITFHRQVVSHCMGILVFDIGLLPFRGFQEQIFLHKSFISLGYIKIFKQGS